MTEPNILEPSIEEVQKAVEQWENDDVSKGLEDFLDKLFAKYSKNESQDPEKIFQKIKALDLIYSTWLHSEETMRAVANHIVNLKGIDEKLEKGDPAIVEQIADTGIKDFYSFASKYCAFHNPEKYALYDSQADGTLWYFQSKYEFSNFKRCELRNYETYLKVIEDFKIRFGLQDFSLRQLDHYLWYTGAELLKSK